MSIEKKPYNFVQMKEYLAEQFRNNPNIPVYITGHEEATHGAVINVLDLVKSVGVKNVSFAISAVPPQK